MWPRPEQFDDWRAWARELIRRENQTSLAKRLAEIIESGSDIAFTYNPGKNTITLDVSALGVTNLGYTASTRLLTSSNGADVTLPLVTDTDAGLAPATGGGTTNFLRADGTWAAPPTGNTDLTYTASTRLLESSTGTDVTLPLVSAGDAGLAPASGGGTTNYLRADGTWAAPPSGGTTLYKASAIRTTNYTKTANPEAIPWSSAGNFNENTVWSGSNATRLTMPTGATAAKFWAAIGLANTVDHGTYIRKNGSTNITPTLFGGTKSFRNGTFIQSPWVSVTGGDYFELMIATTNAWILSGNDANSGASIFACEYII